MLLLTSQTEQQPLRITGTVTSATDKGPLPGVSIVVKGTPTGTITNPDGKYSIEVAGNATLVFSFVGFTNQEVQVQGRNTIDIVMEESLEALDEVVVTALGIRRDEKSLGFSVGKVGGDDVTRVAQENLLNSMSGKVSGVTISSTGGTGSSVNMVIRGASSLSSDNQPLFVVDGVPMNNSINNVGGFGNQNAVDYGNAIADIDPESIESVSILKGANAAALYGSRAGNGVVMITTKKAKDKQKMKVTITSNMVFDVPARYLNTHHRFATGYFSYRPEDFGGGILPTVSPEQYSFAGPELDKGYWAVQWDAPLDANGVPVPSELVSYPNNIKDFINDYASTTTNSVAISSGGELVNYRLGVTNMTHSGLIPNSDLNKNSIALSASSKVTKSLTVSTDINFAVNWANNRPSSNRGANPLQWAYAHPANIDINKLRDYQTGSGIKRVSNAHENPWFLAYDVNNSFRRYLIFGNVAASWDVTDKLNITGRYSLNKSDEVRETKIAPGYTKEPKNGAYGIYNGNNVERNIDILATWKNGWDDFSLILSGGGNIRYARSSRISTSSKSGAGLVVPNVFTIRNISSGSLDYSNARYEREVNSVYGMVNLAWKEMAYVDLTARNDWSSTLPEKNRSYFYPSASLSLMPDQIFSIGEPVNLFKLRGGWAQVGNDTSPYNLLATYGNSGQWGDATRLSKSGGLLAPELKPELITSYEFGTDVRLFSNRLRFEGTYYQNDNENQMFSVPLASSTGFNSIFINAGLIRSKGVEFLLGFTPVKTNDWQWDVSINFTKNKTTVIELAEGIDFIEAWSEGQVKSIAYAKNKAEGHDGLVGDLYSRKLKRVTDKNSDYYGYPLLAGKETNASWQHEEEYTKVGNYNPDFIMGMQTSLSYKNFTLSMTFDWRSGGQYVSQTWRYFSEDKENGAWLDQIVNPGALGGKASSELRSWVVANADKLLFTDRPVPVGGPTPEFGGFPESYSGTTVYDGFFAPGVIENTDNNGNFLGYIENLGGEGTYFLPSALNYPWEIGESNLFDADYIKLREVSLGYRLPNSIARQWGLTDVNFSVYSRNIILWTKDSALGVDPERAFQAESGGRFSQGVERYNVEPWAVPIGFKLSFSF
ncbi:MAG: SusC/RagA family TonB-linked outer membrane protein [Mangrovibacterium sp.]|nr:SusC/RagA family TonB-linked outer membrane protein [Mangrovibacterium sp.]